MPHLVTFSCNQGHVRLQVTWHEPVLVVPAHLHYQAVQGHGVEAEHQEVDRVHQHQPLHAYETHVIVEHVQQLTKGSRGPCPCSRVAHLYLIVSRVYLIVCI
jgi:hypothetical protein